MHVAAPSAPCCPPSWVWELWTLVPLSWACTPSGRLAALLQSCRPPHCTGWAEVFVNCDHHFRIKDTRRDWGSHAIQMFHWHNYCLEIEMWINCSAVICPSTLDFEWSILKYARSCLTPKTNQSRKCVLQARFKSRLGCAYIRSGGTNSGGKKKRNCLTRTPAQRKERKKKLARSNLGVVQ